MRPSPRTPLLDAFPSSPTSVWSCARSRSSSSANQDHPSPPTPDSCFSPAPAIVTPDEFTLQIDVQLDKMVGSPHKSSIAHLLPRPSVPSLKKDPFFLSEDGVGEVQMFLRNRARRENMRDQFESSPPLRLHNTSPFLPLSQDSASDDFSWEATHSALVDPNGPPGPSRCSLLIHEVSLLVGLTAEDDHLSLSDGCPSVPDVSKQVHDILPLSLNPTKSLTSRKHRNAGLPHANVPIHSSFPNTVENVNPYLPLARSGDLAVPMPRHKTTNAVRPSISPRRRQGQVFHFEPPLSSAPPRNTVDLDETFIHPRQPPPKPTQNSPANRCSSLDRLECSLLKLEAHAPVDHRKSRSEERPFDYIAPRKDKRPPLPPPRRLRHHQSSHEIAHRNRSRPAYGCHFPGPLPPTPRPIPPPQYVAPRICPVMPLDDGHLEGDTTPGSFMDMDIPPTEEGHKRRTSFGQVKSKEKMKSLVSAAKRVSRGVITWGKNLMGSTKLPVTAQEATILHGDHV